VAAQYSLIRSTKGTREWFPDEIVCSHLEAEQFVYFLSFRCQKDHRQELSRKRRSVSSPSMRGILTSKMARSGRFD
jgi:hypothetical protein